MHPKNPFRSGYDFNQLIKRFPELKPFVFINPYRKKSINFADPRAVKALNSALLKFHYNISWQLPESNLCPPIPGRLDYLLYVSDLINIKEVRMLDIGTGANLIYPILGTCQFKWRCTGTEVDNEAMQNAKEIINQNAVLAQTELRFQPFKNKILAGIMKKDDAFDVLVCNPPFFRSREDAELKNKRKSRNLKIKENVSLNFGGRSNELWYKGGEAAFVKKMAEESVCFKNQVHWFTSLVSKKENLQKIKRAVEFTNPAEVKVVDMEQGHKKSRFIAWRFR